MAERAVIQETIDPPLPIQEHLRELRIRLFRVVLALLVGFLVCYNFAEQILHELMHPMQLFLGTLGRGEMIFTGVTEPFIIQMKAAFLAGFFLTLPYTAVQVYKFLQPAFRGREKAYFIWLFVLGGVLFATGAAFGYFGVLPYGISFLVGLGAADLVPQLSLNEYFAFSVRLLLAFGVVFELPLAVLLLARLGLVDRYFFARNRRFAVVIIFVAAAILTPPDVLTQMMLAFPLLLLYEGSAQIAKIVGTRDEDEEAEEDEKS